MKIGIDARMYGAAQTGIGIYIKHLIEEIVKLDRENEYRIFLLEPEYFPGHKVGASRHRRLAFEFVLKNILKKAETIIAVSEYTKQDILRHYPVSPDKMTVIYEGARLKDKVCVNEGQIQNLKNKYGIKKPFIFYVGVWRNHKN